MGDVTIESVDWDQVEQNPFFCPDASKIDALDELIRNLKKDGDSIGAKLTVVANNVPVGLGEPVFDRLDADIAYALMGINAVKGVEVGDGFDVVNQRGSQHRDELTPEALSPITPAASSVVFHPDRTSSHIWRLSQRPALPYRVKPSMWMAKPWM